MKRKLGNFIEIFGIVLGLAGIVGFVVLIIKNQIWFSVGLLVFGVISFVMALAISQMLFSLSDIEEDTAMMSKRMEVLEDLNRRAVENDLFSGSPKKKVNIPQKKTGVAAPSQSTPSQGAPNQAIGTGTCFKCGYKGPFSGNNFCPKCGNHSFYVD